MDLANLLKQPYQIAICKNNIENIILPSQKSQLAIAKKKKMGKQLTKNKEMIKDIGFD